VKQQVLLMVLLMTLLQPMAPPMKMRQGLHRAKHFASWHRSRLSAHSVQPKPVEPPARWKSACLKRTYSLATCCVPAHLKTHRLRCRFPLTAT
jgi:hypothetical protein